jgi:hypothetical protein
VSSDSDEGGAMFCVDESVSSAAGLQLVQFTLRDLFAKAS